jgi:hypothetical protein
MATLLVLGSKPQPALPPRAAIDAVACANASGWSAAKLGLPVPDFTLMIVGLATAGRPASRAAREALRGLRTRRLFACPRSAVPGTSPRRLALEGRRLRDRPWYFRWRLRATGYRFEELVWLPRGYFRGLVLELCGEDAALAAQIERRRPSTGVLTLALGLADPRYSGFVLAGFSFEATHAYGANRARTGASTSKHTETDLLVLRRLCERHPRISTTEAIVHERAGVPLLETGGGRGAA